MSTKPNQHHPRNIKTKTSVYVWTWPWTIALSQLYLFTLIWVAFAIIRRYLVKGNWQDALPGLDDTAWHQWCMGGHMTTGAVALLLGPWQFWLMRGHRRNRTTTDAVNTTSTMQKFLHRWMGRMYCSSALLSSILGCTFIVLKGKLVGGWNMTVAFAAAGTTFGVMAYQTWIAARHLTHPSTTNDSSLRSSVSTDANSTNNSSESTSRKGRASRQRQQKIVDINRAEAALKCGTAEAMTATVSKGNVNYNTKVLPSNRDHVRQAVVGTRKQRGWKTTDETALLQQLGFVPGNAVAVSCRVQDLPHTALQTLPSSLPSDPVVAQLYPLAVREECAGEKIRGRRSRGRKRKGALKMGEVENDGGNPEIENDATLQKLLEPFPTMYWLTHPLLKIWVSKLEVHAFGVELEKRLENDQESLDRMKRAHLEYGKSRMRLLTENDRQEVEERKWTYAIDETKGVAGIKNPGAVKCLHAHLAHYLSGDPGSKDNIIGQWVLKRLVEMALDDDLEANVSFSADYTVHRNWAIRSFSQVLAPMLYRYWYISMDVLGIYQGPMPLRLGGVCNEDNTCPDYMRWLDCIHCWTYWLSSLAIAELIIYNLPSDSSRSFQRIVGEHSETTLRTPRTLDGSPNIVNMLGCCLALLTTLLNFKIIAFVLAHYSGKMEE